MPKGSEQLTNSRKEEIIDVCEKLYQTMSFKEITIKEIGKVTSFTRTSIYNYFQTKEEIFIAFMKREYEKWISELESIFNDNDVMAKGDFAKAVAHSLEKRKNLLKLLAMNLFDMEENCRMERLIELKEYYGNAIKVIQKCLDKFFSMTKEEIDEFVFAFLPFMYGIYPYTTITEKQKDAMEQAGVPFRYLTIYQITEETINRLLD